MNIEDALASAGLGERAARQKTALFDALDRRLPSPPRMRWFVPGRIEVLGKHTDYAGGRSLLCAAEQGFCVAAAPRADGVLRILDVAQQATVQIAIAPDLEAPPAGWAVYPSAVARRLARNFPGRLRGADIAIASDLPMAAGMSSSSALVVAIFAVLGEVNRLDDRSEYRASIRGIEDLAGYLGCVENGQTFANLAGDRGVGTFGGSEDHTAILACRPGRLAQYAFSPVRFERDVALPADCVFVVAVSGIVADKLGAARERYNRASLAVGSILAAWREVSGSAGATLASVAAAGSEAVDRLRDALRRRAGADAAWLSNRLEQFLIESEEIVPRASEALARGDLGAFGALVDRSEAAAETLLGNQVPETIWLAREARALGAIAASAFGAGFGGSVWALVRRQEAAEFADRWREAYRRSPHEPSSRAAFLSTGAGPGLIRLD